MDLDFLDRPAPREPHPAQLPEADLLAQCVMERGRRGGPGGQHRNKTATAVTYTHTPTGLSAQASERREPEANRKAALRRLRVRLACEARWPVPAGDARSAVWRARTPGGRVVCAERHVDYPAMLAEALDFAAACGWDQHAAATRLGVSPTQLVRFMGTHAPALAAWNAGRAGRGLGPLRG